MTRPSSDVDVPAGRYPVATATIVEALAQRVADTPRGIAFQVPNSDGRRANVDWLTFATGVRALASSFAARGVAPGTRVAICAATSIEWETAQMAALHVGAAVVGLDLNYPDALLTQLLGDSRARVLVAQDRGVLARFGEASIARLDLVVTFEPGDRQAASSVPTLHDLVHAGASLATPPQQARPDREAVIVHSSGTTGVPKTIAYRHDQLMTALQAILDAFPDIDAQSTLVCWLPLSNLFQRMIDFAAMMRGAGTYMVENPRTVMEHVSAARPEVFIAVPRFLEKLQAGITGRIEARSRLSAFLATQAIALGSRRAHALREGAEAPFVVRLLWPLADRFVLASIRGAFGGKLRYFVSGSAPMPRWLLEWFEAIGLPVLEAYGVSENIVPIAANRHQQRRLGTVGRPMQTHEVRLTEDGEILVRGPGVAQSALDARSDGFLATGDLGEFDRDGFLRIVGRKADVFKSSTGRWIVPAEIEGRLAQVPYIEHAIVSGAGRKATVAIVSLVESRTIRNDDRPASVSDVDQDRLRADAKVALADLPPHQQLAGLLIVPAAGLSIAGGELTTNLKVRRRRVEEKFAADIERLHDAIDRRSPGSIVVLRSGRDVVEPA